MSLDRYHQKRDFKKTSEPKGGRSHKTNQSLFVIQKHAASHLHYDFRLELDGVLKSWAVPKGPCYDPNIKRLAMHVEDHPIEYGSFEGIIPKGEYGGGTVMLWDKGTWQSLDNEPLKAYEKGHLRFQLKGSKLKGRWDLIRFKGDKEWLLKKYQDEHAKPLARYDITKEKPLSVVSHQSLDEISEYYKGIWSSSGYKKRSRSQKIALNPDLKEILGAPAAFPHTISVQLATLVDKPPQGDEWLHEIKLDGYRMIIFKEGKQVRFVSRNHNDWSNEFKSLIPAIQQLSVHTAIFDGEIVILDENGRSNFQRLQNAIKGDPDPDFVLYLFDLLYIDKYDLRAVPLIKRKEQLASVLVQAPDSIRYSDHIFGQGEEILKNSCEFALEGIVSKLIESDYIGRRSRAWLKIKCIKRQEFLVGGFSKPRNTRQHFGALYLGVFNENQLLFCGKAGTGFTEASLKSIHEQLKPLITDKNPFSQKIPDSKEVTWVKPELIAEIEFSEWTEDGRLRQARFKGLRSDKNPEDISKEKELAVETVTKTTRKNKPTKKKDPLLTHPDKVLYKEDKITKRDLYDYYEAISDYILPFITDRPLTLVRCPSDYQDCFYQKHLNHATGKLGEITIQNKSGEEEPYIYLKDKAGLLSLVQMGVLEIHPWGSTIQHVENPDLLVFDLDPGPDLAWQAVVETAFDVKEHLNQYHLTAFVKTTGGKGLHVVVPIQPLYDWNEVKEFTHVFVDYLEKCNPQKYTSNMAKTKRKGKIFIDYLRNQRGATAIAAYSTRARLHAPVATPVGWDELSNNYQDTFYTIHTLPRRLLNLKTDPWGNFWKIGQSLRLDEL
ncbi:DNA ligase D [Legionella fairfieldensis]|uniref:DNA ligase D n=1 Tax=Legionella fairfieldensis TaxID=45064 RepID=UPI00048CB7E7|nr:DNA ligase D [Legionella fairfieldensis]